MRTFGRVITIQTKGEYAVPEDTFDDVVIRAHDMIDRNFVDTMKALHEHYWEPNMTFFDEFERQEGDSFLIGWTCGFERTKGLLGRLREAFR